MNQWCKFYRIRCNFYDLYWWNHVAVCNQNLGMGAISVLSELCKGVYDWVHDCKGALRGIDGYTGRNRNWTLLPIGKWGPS